MINSRRYARLKSLSVTLKHLRGRHDQRDHAWNRGMGKGGGGGLMPAFMSPQQFQALRNDLQQQVTRGEISQEVADLTAKRVREIYNADYDQNIANQLSRRDVTMTTLANQRVGNAQRPARQSVTSLDIMSASQQMTLANMQSYTGNQFTNTIARTGTRSLLTMTANDLSEFERNTRSADGLNIFHSTSAGQRAYDSFYSLVQSMDIRPNIYMPMEMLEVITNFFQHSNPEIDINYDYDSMISPYENMIPHRDDLNDQSKIFDKYKKKFEEFQTLMSTLQGVKWEDFDQSGTSNAHKELQRLIESRQNGAAQWRAIEKIMQEAQLQNITGAQISEYAASYKNNIDFHSRIANPDTLMAMYDFYAGIREFDPLVAFSQDSVPNYHGDIFLRAFAENIRLFKNEANAADIPAYISTYMMRSMPDIFNASSESAVINADALQTIIDIFNSNELWGNPIRDLMPNASLNSGMLSPGLFEQSLYTGQDAVIPQLFAANQDYKAYGLLNGQFEKLLREAAPAAATGPSPLAKEQIKKYFETYLQSMYSALENAHNLNDNQMGVLFNFTADASQLEGYITSSELIDLHLRAATTPEAQRRAAFMAGIVESNEEARLYNTYTTSERLRAVEQSLLQRRESALASGDTANLERINARLDDIRWESFVTNNLSFNSSISEEDLLQQRLSMPFESQQKKQQVEMNLEEAKQKRRDSVDALGDQVMQRVNSYLQSTGDTVLLRSRQAHDTIVYYFDQYQDSILRDGASLDDALNSLVKKLEQFEKMGYNTESLQAHLQQQYQNMPDMSYLNEEREALFKNILTEAWGDATPTLVTPTTPIQKGTLTFESPAYAFGSPMISMDMFNQPANLLPPDNPDETPFFNPAYARFGARAVIDEKTKNPISLMSYDNTMTDRVANALEAMGYTNEMIDNILSQLTDSLIPCPRDGTRINVYFEDNVADCRLRFSWDRNDSEFVSNGTLSIDFRPNPADTRIETYVGLTVIPEFKPLTSEQQVAVNLLPYDKREEYTRSLRREPSKYKGASGPVLMLAADQSRRIAYRLGTPNAYFSAQAADIAHKGAGQNSGPTTWPVLGATTEVTVNTQLRSKLRQMGFTAEFVNSLPAGGTIPSSLFFLNAPPNIFINGGRVGEQIKIKTTAQALWSEIYDTGNAPKGFHVELNIASPNDPGRLWNPMLPRPKNKEWNRLLNIRYKLFNVRKMLYG